MDIISKPIRFQWDKGNIAKSLKKHGITNEKAEEVFLNIPVVLLEDKRHSKTEKRHLVLGKSDQGKLLSIVFTARAKLVRIISARPMSRKERKLYEKQSKA